MASSLKPDIMVTPADLFIQTSPTSGTVPYTTFAPELGVRAVTGDGREFRYAQAGLTALVPGTLLQGPAQVANHIQLTPLAAAVGATTVSVTLGATAIVANQYTNGFLVVSADGGSGGQPGYVYQIASNPAAALSTAVVITLADPLLNKITTSAKIDLVMNPFGNGAITAGTDGVIIYPTTATSSPVGVAINALAIANYGWIQVKGLAPILDDAGGGITVGNGVVPSTSVAGAVKSATGTPPVVGVAATTVTASQVGTFKLSIE